MDAKQWSRLRTEVGRALALPPEARRPFLDSVFGDDPALHAEALALVAIDTRELDEHAGALFELNAAVPEHIGPFAIEREIGRGGMARVFLGRRTDAADPRPVAVKLLHRELIDHEVVRRFQREGEILRRFRHPHIAAFLEGGTTTDGRPYLVMERVTGRPIDQFRREQQLDLDATLILFQVVCRAVAHAHRALVVHRDLKPSNILVTDDGEPRVLDFGIAKLLDPHSRHPLTVTSIQSRALTPAYASPEQIRGEVTTTACDVYGLGVVLYELLTGRLPFTGRGEALRRTIEHEEPMPPSQALGTADPKTRRWLRGDLDTIVLKTLAKDPDARYASVDRLVQDIERFRTHRPLEARPPRLPYRLRKLVRRQRRALLATGLAVVALSTLAVDRERQRDELRRQRDKAVAIQSFLLGVFDESDPRVVGAPDDALRDVVRAGVERLERLAATPVVEADIAQVLGRVCLNLSLFDDAEVLLARALRQQLALQGEDSADVAATRDLLGQLYRFTGRLDDAVTHLEAALAFRRDEQPRDDVALLAVLNNLALTRQQQGRQSEAERLARDNLAHRLRHFGEKHVEAAYGLNNLGTILMSSEEPDLVEVTDLFERALRIRIRALGNAHPEVAVTLNNLGSVHYRAQAFDLAEVRFREAVTIWRAALGDRHIEVVQGDLNLAASLQKQGKLTASIAQLVELRPRARAVVGEDHILVDLIDERLAEMRASLTGDGNPTLSAAPP